MSKSLLGGGAATMVVLLSASLIFNAEPSVAEPLAFSIVDTQTEQLKGEADAETPSETTPEVAEPVETGGPEDVVKVEKTASSLAKNREKTDGQKADQSSPVQSVSFVATAYSLRGRTASGKQVSRGLIAADRRVLPLGSRVRIDAGNYSGEYLVADTGGLVRGRKIDIWMPSSGEAMRFGRRTIKLTVLTYGGRRAAATTATPTRGARRQR